MRYLLDTNIISVLVDDPEGALAQRVSALDDSEVCTSIIVAAEVWYGVSKRRSRRLRFQVETVLQSIKVLPIQPPIEVIYGDLRTSLEAIGQPIGPNDLLIAAQALALDLIVVTDNVSEFSRVDGLRVENWLREDVP